MRIPAALLTIVFCAACSTPEPVSLLPLPARINSAKLVDLSYSFDENTVYWPNAEGFRHRKDSWTMTPNGYWYAAGEFTSAVHGGPHTDSPIHFAKGKRTLDQIPVSQ